MADVTKPARRTRRRAESTASKPKEEVEQATQEEPRDDAQEDTGSGGDDNQGQNGSGDDTLIGELKSTIREAAIEVLRPVAKQATTTAAKYAVSKGPDLVKDKVVPKVAGAGGAGAIAKGVLSKGGGAAGGVGQLAGGIAEKVGGGKGKGGKKPTGHGRGRRLPVQEYVDVAVDIETAYDQFTQFEDWPNFMHRLEKVEQRDDTTLMFNENIWGVRRSWEAEIVEQKPCERIVWRSKGPLQTVGVATFHRLSDNLTRVQINMDFQPQGLFEKTASGMRLSRRALRSDLMRFKAFMEMRDDTTGSWRGTIEEGEVTETPEDAEQSADEDREGEEPEAAEGEEPEAAEDEDFDESEEDEGAEDEPDASGEEEDEDDYEEEPEASAEDDEEEPEASAEDDEEEPEASAEDDEDEPEASAEDDEDEPEASAEDDEDEPEASAEDDQDEEPPTPPRRRSRAKAGTAAGSPRRRSR